MWPLEQKFQSGSHMTIIIQNFILVSLISIVTSHLIGLSLGATVPFLPIYLTPYVLVSLYTRLTIMFVY